MLLVKAYFVEQSQVVARVGAAGVTRASFKISTAQALADPFGTVLLANFSVSSAAVRWLAAGCSCP